VAAARAGQWTQSSVCPRGLATGLTLRGASEWPVRSGGLATTLERAA